MRILITGASGFIGSELVSFFTHYNHELVRLIRPGSQTLTGKVIQADLEKDKIPLADLEDFDVVIHLAGENITNKKWTEKQKKKIYDSRVLATQNLANAVANLTHAPKLFISASAIGYYGDRPDEYINETSVSIKGDFLSDTCKDWEQATEILSRKGIRTVNARFGLVIGARGGLIKKLKPIFNLGLGGVIGSGKQLMSWIAIDDLVYAMNYIIHNESISGPVNFTAPKSISNREFTHAFAKSLSRPVFMSIPSFVLKLIFGEMADSLLLSSCRVRPYKLLDNGYEFAYPEIDSALTPL
jgi:uncharacterized protein (TIGR01777 family)